MIQNDKKAFRRQMLARRDAIPLENRIEADKVRNERIRNWAVYQEAKLMLFYVSYRSEADTIQLLKEALTAGRCVAVPKVVGTELVFYRITDFSQLVEGYRGILEPDTERTETVTEGEGCVKKHEAVSQDASLLFVPGCAFDERGGRMGYGGGFYDRFMEKYPQGLRVALAYEEQMVAEVPRQAHDRLVDVIVTQERMVQVAKA